MNASAISTNSACPSSTGFATILTALVLTGPLAAPALAEAQSTEIVQTRRVDLSDLDLSRAAGMKAAHWRLAAAAREVCGDHIGRMPLEEHADIEACKKQAMTHAERDLAALASRSRHYARDGNRSVEIRLFFPAIRD